MNATEAAAWWGAIAGSAAVFWDIIKWSRAGARVRLQATPNMQLMVPGLGLNPEKRIYVNARNVGDQPTTITNFCGEHYPSRWHRLIKRGGRFFVITPGADVRMPHKLGPGETWSGYALQDEMAKVDAQSGALYLGVQHSMAKKPKLTRVDLSGPAA